MHIQASFQRISGLILRTVSVLHSYYGRGRNSHYAGNFQESFQASRSKGIREYCRNCVPTNLILAGFTTHGTQLQLIGKLSADLGIPRP